MRPRSGTHAIAFVLVTVLLDTVGFGIVIPVLPTLIVHLTGEPLSRAAVYGGWLATPSCSSSARPSSAT